MKPYPQTKALVRKDPFSISICSRIVFPAARQGPEPLATIPWTPLQNLVPNGCKGNKPHWTKVIAGFPPESVSETPVGKERVPFRLDPGPHRGGGQVAELRGAGAPSAEKEIARRRAPARLGSLSWPGMRSPFCHYYSSWGHVRSTHVGCSGRHEWL